MNILVMEDSSKSNFGGGQKVTIQVSEVLSNKHKLLFSDFCKESIYQNKLKEKFPSVDILPLKRKRYRFEKPVLSMICNIISIIIYFLPNVIKLRRMFRERKIDCIYCTTRLTLIYANVIKTITNKPFVYHAHLVNNRIQAGACLWDFFAGRAKAVLCVSKTVLESLKCKNCILLYNPNKNTFGYKGNKTSSDFVVASIGSLIPIKGFEYVIEAARMRPKINFRIYGIGELYEQLSKDAPENVRFMGFCNDVISELYADVDIVVVPTFIQEALSLVIVESKSVGLPVICTNIGGQSEIVSDGVDGYKVPIKDSSAIAEKIDLLSRDLSLYNKISSNAFKNSYLFSYEIFTEKLNQIFE